MAQEKKKTAYVNVSEKIMLDKAPWKFPYLEKPDTSTYALGKCKDGLYKVTPLYKIDSAFIKELTKKLDALYERGCAEVAKIAATMPTTNAKQKAEKKAFETIYPKNDYFKNDTNKEGDETGYIAVNAKLKATDSKGRRNSFVMVDAGRNNIKPGTPIWGGTVGKVQVIAKFYNLAGPKQSGISLEILGVQILTLVGPDGGQREQGSADAFDEEEGFTADQSVETEGEEQNGGDEQVPF